MAKRPCLSRVFLARPGENLKDNQAASERERVGSFDSAP